MGGVLEGLSKKLDRFRQGFLPPIPVDVPIPGILDFSRGVIEDIGKPLFKRQILKRPAHASFLILRSGSLYRKTPLPASYSVRIPPASR